MLYITYRTADNFINGYGLRWNVAERVQMYTHPLWMFLFTAVYAIGRNAYYASVGLAIAFSVGTIVLYAARLASRAATAALGILALISSRAFID